MKTLTIQLPDEVYEACQKMAVKYGRTLEECALEFMVKYGPKPRTKLTEEERKTALERLLRHAGAQSLGHPTGTDNAGIDADLAREYGSSHEEGDCAN